MDTKTLFSFLEDQKKIQTGLYDLSLEKRRVIISDETDQLSEIVQRELQLLSQLNTLEKRRAAVLEEWAGYISCPPDEITLSKILENLDRDDSGQISALQQELYSLMTSLRDLNDENGKLLEAKLEYTDTMLNLYVGAEDPLNNIYGAAGKTDAEMRKSTGMFNWEA